MTFLRVEFRAMASKHEIVLDSDNRDRAHRAIEAAIADVDRIEAKYSRYRDDSVTTLINRAAGGAPVNIDDETAALLAYADRCYALSQGRFDVTSGVLRRVWDFRRTPPELPAADALEAARALIGWERVERDSGRVRLAQVGMEIDFGGIGKEYAADRAATILAQQGERHGFVNLGGDIRVLGPRRDQAPWRIGIRDPRIAGEAPAALLELSDGALATSGDYERHFVVEGRRYCHLIDARTGWPVSAWRSISVVAPMCVVAGSCATIAMLLEGAASRFLDEQAVAWLGIAANGSLHGTLLHRAELAS